MQWLLNLRLRYKFWLVNSASFGIALALVACAVWVHAKTIEEREAQSAQARLEAWLPVLKEELSRAQVLSLMRGDWFALPAEGSVTSAQTEGWGRELQQLVRGHRGAGILLRRQGVSQWQITESEYWVVAAFVPEQDLVVGIRVATPTLLQTAMAQAPVYALAVFLLMVVLLVVSQLLISFIERHINRLRHVMLEVQHKNDLTLRVPIDCRDEIGQMAEAFNQMQQGYQDTVRSIRDSASHLNKEVHALTRAAADTDTQMDRQQSQTEQMVTAMHEMANAAQEVAQNAAGTHEVSENAAERALAGDACVGYTQTAIIQLSDEILAASRLIEQLNENSQRIESATSQIQTISDQTNLLALNAAIEAARAGEVGRGFAVVADEVRNLARHAHEASAAINQVVASIRAVTGEVTATMVSSRSMAEQCVERAEDAALVLRDINQVVEQIKDKNLMIATAAEEQSQVSETISDGLRAIREDTALTAATAASVAEAGQQIQLQAERLIDLVQRMRI